MYFLLLPEIHSPNHAYGFGVQCMAQTMRFGPRMCPGGELFSLEIFTFRDHFLPNSKNCATRRPTETPAKAMKLIIQYRIGNVFFWIYTQNYPIAPLVEISSCFSVTSTLRMMMIFLIVSSK